MLQGNGLFTERNILDWAPIFGPLLDNAPIYKNCLMGPLDGQESRPSLKSLCMGASLHT